MSGKAKYGWANLPSKTTPYTAENMEAFGEQIADYADAQIALKGEKIWPDDPRIANPIDLTGAKFSDVGFQELLDLADPGYQVQGVGTIAWPARCKVKLQAEHAQSARVLHWAPDNRNNGPIWEWPKNSFSEKAVGVYAAATSTGLKGGNPAVTTGQTTIKLVGVNGSFKPSGTALLGGKPFTYGKISHVEGEGENRTTWLEECVGVVGNGRAWVMQGVALQIAGDGSHLTVLPARTPGSSVRASGPAPPGGKPKSRRGSTASGSTTRSGSTASFEASATMPSPLWNAGSWGIASTAARATAASR